MSKISKGEMLTIKSRMAIFTDLFGMELLDRCDIKNAKTLKELSDIIDRHHDHLSDRCTDAQAHLTRFQKELGLYNLD